MKNVLSTKWKQTLLVRATEDQRGTITIPILVGYIAKESDGGGSWKVYSGAVLDTKENRQETDIAAILAHGAALTEKEAGGFFPEFKNLPYRK